MAECHLCACLAFEPNQWRKTLCQHCFHGKSAHSSAHVDVPQWYFAKIEGPFSYEQCSHWMKAGYFSPSTTLIRSSHDPPTAWVPLGTAFPDPETAFLPPDHKEEEEVGPDARVIDPEVIREKTDWITTYFNRGTSWYFIDAQGEVQPSDPSAGGFEPKLLIDWWKAGYFWNPDLMICHQGWDNFVTLQSILDAPESLAVGSPSAAGGAAGQEYEYEYEDKETAQDVPEAEYAVEEAEVVAELVDSEADGVFAAAAAAAAEVEGEDGAAGAAAEDGEAEAEAEVDDGPKEWLYGDENGELQGPYSGATMLSWLQWEYFSPDTLVRHESVSEFCTIAELFPGETEAFSGEDWRWYYSQLHP